MHRAFPGNAVTYAISLMHSVLNWLPEAALERVIQIPGIYWGRVLRRREFTKKPSKDVVLCNI